MWPVGSSSLTRDGTQAPCIWRVESQPPEHQGSPLTHLITESLYLLTTFIQFSLILPTASGDHKSDLLYHELSVFDVVLIIRLMVGQPYAIFVFIHIFPPDIVKHSYDLSFVRIMELEEEEGQRRGTKSHQQVDMGAQVRR